MDNLKDAIAGLHDRPDFEILVKHLNDMKDGYIGDLTSTASVENPQILAHIAGCISVLDNLIREINDARPTGSWRTD